MKISTKQIEWLEKIFKTKKNYHVAFENGGMLYAFYNRKTNQIVLEIENNNILCLKNGDDGLTPEQYEKIGKALQGINPFCGIEDIFSDVDDYLKILITWKCKEWKTVYKLDEKEINEHLKECEWDGDKNE